MSSVIMSQSARPSGPTDHRISLHHSTHNEADKSLTLSFQSDYKGNTHSDNTRVCELVHHSSAGRSVSAGSADIRSEPPPKSSGHKQQASTPAHLHMLWPLVARGHYRELSICGNVYILHPVCVRVFVWHARA